jgi:oxygen-independent coproporphyrinogen-3 oxidase
MAGALYVHIPYCISKCPYCDFTSIPADDSIDAFIDSLCKEIEQRHSAISTADTLFIGGGTPTVLKPHQFFRLFHHLKSFLTISPLAEITVEGNPCTLSPAIIAALASAGVNRVSVGAQSFFDEELGALGRKHRVDDIYVAVAELHKHGIGNINLDLMFGIPGQTAGSWRSSLEKAVSLQPAHISAYCLTYEPGTPFDSLLKAGALRKKSEDEELELYEQAREYLLSAGYEHYEISNFALPGRRCAHNLIYWSNEEYLGLGASAVSYLGGKRLANVREPAKYIESMRERENAIAEAELISPHMQAIETMIQRLRLSDAIDCRAFQMRFGIHPAELFGNIFDESIERHLIEYREDTLRSTFAGWRVANEIALRLLP